MLDTRAQVGKVNTLEANQGIYFIVSEADSDPDITTGLDIIPDPLA